MSGVETLLAEVLAAHERGPWVEVSDGLHRPSCSCGALLDAKARNESESRHRAAEQAKALREWLTSGGAVSCIEDHSWSHRAHRVCRCGFNADPNKREFSVTQHARHVLAALTDLIGADS